MSINQNQVTDTLVPSGGLTVTFTGQAATTIRTVAQIRTTEMTY